MFESYQLQRHSAEVANLREAKCHERQKCLGRQPLAQMNPELVGARWRLDLLWQDLKLGLKIRTPEGMAFKPLDYFDNASPAIAELSRWFEQNCPMDNRMSLRFREGVDGIRGIWLDASRVDLDHLKNRHADWVTQILNMGIVLEVGQRHEEWACDPSTGQIKSTRAGLRPWLPSYRQDLSPMNLLSTVASFSQPGPLANQTLISAGHALLDKHLDWRPGVDAWGEWGAGNGNLSASFAQRLGDHGAWISEPDPKSFVALKHNHGLLFANAEISRTAAIQAPQNFNLWILDPPRSGFSSLIKRLEPNHSPATVLIYHCAMDGLTRDSDALRQAQYELRDWIFCDVFPGSNHAEAVSLWTHSPC